MYHQKYYATIQYATKIFNASITLQLQLQTCVSGQTQKQGPEQRQICRTFYKSTQ